LDALKIFTIFQNFLIPELLDGREEDRKFLAGKDGEEARDRALGVESLPNPENRLELSGLHGHPGR
jgi:hypothetical protein